jgi:hypothetical protein
MLEKLSCGQLQQIKMMIICTFAPRLKTRISRAENSNIFKVILGSSCHVSALV